MKKNNNIDEIRENIDSIDAQIVELLSRRGKWAHEIGEIKKGEGKKVYVPSREQQIFERLKKLNPGPYEDRALRAVFREIISATRALEEPIQVSFLGPETTFTHQAAVEHFGHEAKFSAKSDINLVFKEVETGRADFGVVPIENSIEGVVNYTLDKFVDSNLKICSEIVIPVGLHLLSSHEELSKIKTIYSHPHALAQCRQWISNNLPQAELKPTDSTAAAAETSQKKKHAAAIASSLAADQFSLSVLAKNIQDQTSNFTRFLVLGDLPTQPTGDDKTSIAFISKDKPGILYELLKPLADQKINLTKIESRPLKTKVWEYMFFVDLDGHENDPAVKEALSQIQKECALFKILGSYPKFKGDL